jgi:MFS family permease
MAYEGMRSSTGPFLATLGASGTAVGIIAGTGELFGYLLRLGSGRLAERTRAYWPIAIAGYALQMAAVPLLAFAGNWMMAAIIIVAERAGKALRNPAANTMMSKAGEQIGQGWAFGLHEALDQTGALVGPLIAALVLALHGGYREAFLWLGVPAALTIISVVTVSLRYPFAGNIASSAAHDAGTSHFSRAFWFYALASALVGFGFADWPLIAYHDAKAGIVSSALIPVFYAFAMGASGASSLAFGRWFDRSGLFVLVPGILIGAAVAPLAFYGATEPAFIGALLWGVALGVHDAIMNAAVARMVPEASRARAYGIFTAIYGIAWFLGSAVLGLIYDVSVWALVAVSVFAELGALIPLLLAIRALDAAKTSR